MKINLLIPCFNEEDSLLKLHDTLSSFKSNHDLNFYILDNGSTDNTKNVIKNLKYSKNINFLYLDLNQGYGYGVNYGLNQITNADFIGWFHGDMQFDINNLTTIIEQIEEVEKNFVNYIFFKGIRIGRPFISKLFSKSMAVITSILLLNKYYEINAQPTIFTAKLLEKVEEPPSDFSFDTYIYWIARKNKSLIIRKKVKFQNRKYGNSKWDFGIISKVNFSLTNLKYIFKLSLINIKNYLI